MADASLLNMVNVECLRFDALNDQVRAELVQLRDGQDIYDNPFFDLDFAELVASVRSDTRLLIANDDEGLLGVWALHVRPNKWTRPIAAPFSDWHGPIIRAGADLSPEDFLAGAGLAGMTATGLQPTQLSGQCGGELSACGIAETPNGGDAYRAEMKGLHSKHFKNLRRAERMIARDFEHSELTLDDTSLEAFEWLMTLKQEQYTKTGKHNVLKPDWVQVMMETLRTKRYPRLRGRLSTLRLDGKLAAAEFDILSDKVVHGWITAYSQDYAKYSPGHLLMLAVICNLSETGHVSCDIGTGDQAYKTYYESHQRPSERAIIQTPGGMRPLASTWSFVESNAPARLAGVMTRMRRRSDQIVSAELDLGGRVKGFCSALMRKA